MRVLSHLPSFWIAPLQSSINLREENYSPIAKGPVGFYTTQSSQPINISYAQKSTTETGKFIAIAIYEALCNTKIPQTEVFRPTTKFYSRSPPCDYGNFGLLT